MRNLVNTFPRQIAFPRRKYVENETEFYKLIDKYNGLKDCYYSVYALDEDGKFDHVKVDKVFFDFDGGDLAVENAKKLANYLFEEDIKHIIIYSGKKGFHIYVFTINYEDLHYPKDALYNCHVYYEKMLDFKLDDPVRGNVAQIARIPNTWHTTGERYCRPINKTTLQSLTFDEIRDKCKEQNFNLIYYGSKSLDMKQFDKPNGDIHKVLDIPNYSYSIDIDDELIKKLHPCIQRMLLEPGNYCKNRSRYLFALYCRVRGIPPRLCDEVAKKYWGCVKESGGNRSKYLEFREEKQIEYAYKTDKPFPNCDSMFSMGWCSGKCSKYEEGNFPLYKR